MKPEGYRSKIKGSLVHLTQQGDNSGLEGAGNATNTIVAVSFQVWHDTRPHTHPEHFGKASDGI